jgi:hypothetical protein
MKNKFKGLWIEKTQRIVPFINLLKIYKKEIRKMELKL